VEEYGLYLSKEGGAKYYEFNELIRNKKWNDAFSWLIKYANFCWYEI
jgi:hypothetical protein